MHSRLRSTHQNTYTTKQLIKTRKEHKRKSLCRLLAENTFFCFPKCSKSFIHNNSFGSKPLMFDISQDKYPKKKHFVSDNFIVTLFVIFGCCKNLKRMIFQNEHAFKLSSMTEPSEELRNDYRVYLIYTNLSNFIRFADHCFYILCLQ